MITPIITVLLCLGTVAVVGTVVSVVAKYGAVNPITRARNAKKERVVRKLAKDTEHNPNAEKKVLKKLYKNRLHCAKIGFMTPESTDINSKTFSDKKLNKFEKQRQKFTAKMKLAELNGKQEKAIKYEEKLERITPVQSTKFKFIETKKVAGHNVEFNSNSIYCNSEYSQVSFMQALKQKIDDSNYPRVVEIFSGDNRMALLRSTNQECFRTGLTSILAETYVSALQAEKNNQTFTFSLSDFNYGSEDGKTPVKASKRKMHTDEYTSSAEVKSCAIGHYLINEKTFDEAVSNIKKEFDNTEELINSTDELSFI